MAELIIEMVAGAPRRIWCDRCLTTAGIEVDMYVVSPSGLSPAGTARTCNRCDGDAKPEPDDQVG